MLEFLPNELLLDLFEFLDAVELFRTFHNLNSRFNSLLFIHFRRYRVNFHSVVKYPSDLLAHHYFSLITSQTISLRLSDNNDKSPPQTDLFFSSGLQINQFINLRSLSLCYIDNDAILSKIIVDCHQLAHFTHLKVAKCSSVYTNSVDFSNTIWTLPKLTHCRLDTQRNFPTPTMVSLSLKYLSISCRSYGLNQVTHLFQQTPYLQRLHIPLNQQHDNQYQKLPSIQSITMLKLTNVRSSDAMMNILHALPNLTHLKVDTYYIDYDGYRWEEVIDHYLPKLKCFHLRMHIKLYMKNNMFHVDELIDSFRTQFWLEKHQWYVHCHPKFETNYVALLLYTLPYTFPDVSLNKFKISMYKSTCPRENDYLSYNQVHNLSCDSSLSIDCFSSLRFSNIRNLTIELCLDKKFWNNVPIFFQLTSITVLKTDNNVQFHLQSLLNRAPCLYSLTMRSWPCSELPVIKNTNTSLRRLDLRINDLTQNYLSFNNEACKTFIQSSFAIQCEELLLKVHNRQNILDLANGMRNLRLLLIDDNFKSSVAPDDETYSRKHEDLLAWLENHLPSTCTLFKSSSNNIIWIRLEKS